MVPFSLYRQPAPSAGAATDSRGLEAAGAGQAGSRDEELPAERLGRVRAQEAERFVGLAFQDSERVRGTSAPKT